MLMVPYLCPSIVVELSQGHLCITCTRGPLVYCGPEQTYWLLVFVILFFCSPSKTMGEIWVVDWLVKFNHCPNMPVHPPFHFIIYLPSTTELYSLLRSVTPAFHCIQRGQSATFPEYRQFASISLSLLEHLSLQNHHNPPLQHLSFYLHNCQICPSAWQNLHLWCASPGSGIFATASNRKSFDHRSEWQPKTC